jgi:hypothetical protein
MALQTKVKPKSLGRTAPVPIRQSRRKVKENRAMRERRAGGFNSMRGDFIEMWHPKQHFRGAFGKQQRKGNE